MTQTRSDRAGPHRWARVCVIEGPDAPIEAELGPAGLVVGSGNECGLRLNDRRVSRNHMQITVEDSGFRIRDLQSTNGTFLDGVRVDNARVPVGSTLMIGKSVLRLWFVDDMPQLVTPSTRSSFGGLLGGSLAMREIFGVLERVVGSTASVLVEGETGTGKEVVARALHTEGPRAEFPFVAVDCGAIPGNLIESELFGHQRGAFTGALDSRPGLFERAHQGVLFLDEVGELPLEMQPKLLRVLEMREVRKLGASRTQAVDVRVVAGTNRNLHEMVDEGTFRADLFYRLAVVHVELPPLRRRLEDVALLAAHLLRNAGALQPGDISGPNLERLLAHDWPGNVRELRNVLQRAFACSGNPATPFSELSLHVGGRRRPTELPRKPVPSAIDLDVPFANAKETLIDGFESAYLQALLEETEGNVAAASRRSGINRRHLYDLLKKHAIRV